MSQFIDMKCVHFTSDSITSRTTIHCFPVFKKNATLLQH